MFALDGAGEREFGAEPFFLGAGEKPLVAHHLEGDRFAAVGVFGEPHLAHTAASEQSDEPKSVEKDMFLFRSHSAGMLPQRRNRKKG